MRAIRRLLALAEESVPALLLALIVVIVTFAVIMRYGFGRPPAWAGELAVTLFVWQLFLGVAAAARQRRHIGVEMLVRRLPERWRAAQELTQNAAVLVVLGAFVYLGWQFSLTPSKQLLLIDLDYAWVYRAVPAGFLLAAVHVGADMVRAAVGLVRGGYEPPTPTADLPADLPADPEAGTVPHGGVR